MGSKEPPTVAAAPGVSAKLARLAASCIHLPDRLSLRIPIMGFDGILHVVLDALVPGSDSNVVLVWAGQPSGND
jgi:hypothetical protein